VPNEIPAGPRPQPFRILALDGGGILGAYTAAFLADIEGQVGRPLADFFDLIAGTSTGGIIAAALAAGEPAKKVVEFYTTWGPVIFTRRQLGPGGRAAGVLANRFLTPLGLDYASVVGPSYAPDPLRQALNEVFEAEVRDGDGTTKRVPKTIGDIRRSRLVMPAVDLVKGETLVIKTPHRPNLWVRRHWSVTEAVLATTAAPTFFPHAHVKNKGDTDDDAKATAFVDGGLWANNPSLVAVTEAIVISNQCKRAADPVFGLGDVWCLSIGTGRHAYSMLPDRPPGIGWWMSGKRIFTAMMASQAQAVNYQTRLLLTPERYRRVDFEVPDPSWTIDNARVIGSLVTLGRRKAQEEYAGLKPHFFATPTTPYEPYPEP
jgi:predicted acylesterase/phospholipase RssA